MNTNHIIIEFFYIFFNAEPDIMQFTGSNWRIKLRDTENTIRQRDITETSSRYKKNIVTAYIYPYSKLI